VKVDKQAVYSDIAGAEGRKQLNLINECRHTDTVILLSRLIPYADEIIGEH
jgi:hypothetical protein